MSSGICAPLPVEVVRNCQSPVSWRFSERKIKLLDSQKMPLPSPNVFFFFNTKIQKQTVHHNDVLLRIFKPKVVQVLVKRWFRFYHKNAQSQKECIMRSIKMQRKNFLLLLFFLACNVVMFHFGLFAKFSQKILGKLAFTEETKHILEKKLK